MSGHEPPKMDTPSSNEAYAKPLPMSPPPPGSPVPLLRPPVPGANRGGSRTPRLGLSIPPSPSQRPVGNSATVPEMPPLQRPSSSRPAAPQLRLATPQGSNSTPHEGPGSSRPFGPSALSSVSAGGPSGDASAHSRKGSFGMLDGRASVPSSASSASHSALSFANGARQSGGTPDPASAISSIYSHEGGAGSSERGGANDPAHLLPDLEKLSLEKGRELDVDDLDDDGWLAASKAGRIEELGTLGEGAGGAVTKCRLKGGKTVFALKVNLSVRVMPCAII